MTVPTDQENFSSPQSILDLPSSSQEVPPSSPLAPTPPPASSTTRPRKRPPITPRRFTRFFNPPKRPKISSQALREITATVNNGRAPHPYFGEPSNSRSNKRRKILPVNDGLSEPIPDSSPLPRICEGAHETDCISLSTYEQQHEEPVQQYCRPIRRAKKPPIRPEWRTQVADFWTSKCDWHDYNDHWGMTAMPFCAAACNTNSLMAFGDETGCVRLVETAKGSVDAFQTPHIQFMPHSNAIMDIAFSSDDMLLATASGDQTGRIIDMRTQQTLSILAHGTSTVKQILFQPGSDSIVATCSRKQAVNVWDLRCQTTKPQVSLSFDPPNAAGIGAQTRYGSVVASIPSSTSSKLARPALPGSHAPSTPTNRGTGSVTCISFLSSSRPHHIVTATDSNALISLWDIRQKHRSARSLSTDLPISTSAPIPAHVRHRDFGISSLALNTDASRLYSVCKDNTVYVYSTSHLVLGSASSAMNNSSTHALSSTRACRQSNPSGTISSEPLYGLRHPKLHIPSFYVRAAVRKASSGHDGAELLAVGSGDNCAVVFPTDEAVLRQQCHPDVAPSGSYEKRRLNTSEERYDCRDRSRRSKDNHPGVQAEKNEDVPLYSTGLPLVAAHEREVTGVAWAHGGELVTIGDDYKVCLWHEDERHGLEKTHYQTAAAELRYRDKIASIKKEQRKLSDLRNGIHFHDVEDPTHGWAEIDFTWDFWH